MLRSELVILTDSVCSELVTGLKKRETESDALEKVPVFVVLDVLHATSEVV